MSNEPSLIATIAVSLAFAFVGGYLAVRLHLPPLVGYLLAGVAVGPFTPGFVADPHLASELAEIGVILLMFGVGLHFSVRDLWGVRAIALPGALVQIAVATVSGAVAARAWGWSLGAGVVFGLCLSVASTVVLLRALEERGELDSAHGRIAVGWLVVEDLFMVLVLVFLPALAQTLNAQGTAVNLWATLGWTVLRVVVFIVLMLVLGNRLFPRLLILVEDTAPRELFTLAVVALALGVALISAELFGVSFALGAFFAGVVINESDLSRRAANDLLPLQNAFGALFFVAVGILFDPAIVVLQPLHLLVAVLIVVVGKSMAALLIVVSLRQTLAVALTISAALAQIGEFSFILAGLGLSVGLIPEEAQNLVLATALISITLNPLIFYAVSRLQAARVPSVL